MTPPPACRCSGANGRRCGNCKYCFSSVMEESVFAWTFSCFFSLFSCCKLLSSTLTCPSNYPLWHNGCTSWQGLICLQSCLLLTQMLKPALFDTLTLSISVAFLCQQFVGAVNCTQVQPVDLMQRTAAVQVVLRHFIELFRLWIWHSIHSQQMAVSEITRSLIHYILCDHWIDISGT